MNLMQQTPVIILPRQNTSLRPLAEDADKLLLTIGNRPIIYLTLKKLADSGIREVILPVWSDNDFLKAYLQTIRIPGLELRTITIDDDLDELSVLASLQAKIDERRFFVLTSDVLLMGDLQEVFEAHTARGAKATVGIRQLPFDNRLSDAFFTSECVVKDHLNPYNYDWHHYACGIYLLENDVFDDISQDAIENSLSAFLFNQLEIQDYIHLMDAEHLCEELRNLDDYLHANFSWVRKNFNSEEKAFIDSGGENGYLRIGEVYVDPDAYVSPGAVLIGPTVIGRDCHIEKRVVIQRSVLRRNVHVEGGAIVRDCIVNRDVVINAQKQHVNQLILDDAMTFKLDNFKQVSSILKKFPPHLSAKRPVIFPNGQSGIDLHV